MIFLWLPCRRPAHNGEGDKKANAGANMPYSAVSQQEVSTQIDTHLVWLLETERAVSVLAVVVCRSWRRNSSTLYLLYAVLSLLYWDRWRNKPRLVVTDHLAYLTVKVLMQREKSKRSLATR